MTNSVRAVIAPRTLVEYVDSDGKYDYVDLGVMANAGIEMEATMEWLAAPGERGFVGARSHAQQFLDSNGDPARVFPYSSYVTSQNEAQHAYHYNHSRYTVRDANNTAVPIAKNVAYRIASRLDQGSLSIAVWRREDGAWVKLGERAQSSSDNINLNLPLYLFAINEDGESARFFVKARVYRLKLRVKQQDGSYELVRDYVPVRDPVTGGAALWDKVSEGYFRNSGKYQLAGGGAERAWQVGAVILIK